MDPNTSLIIKAAVLVELNKPLEIMSLQSQPLLPGQVLVKVLFSGVCRSQIMEMRGLRGEDSWLPHLLGHEGSGIVVATGPEVTKVEVNDEVILTWIKGNGIEGFGAKYDHEGEIINSGMVTTFSNYSVISENRLIKKPKNLAFDTAILFGCALPTGAGMVLNEVDISSESSVIVIGLGGIGFSAIAMLLSLKVRNIIAIDISDEKLQKVKSWGVSNVINPKKSNIKELVNEVIPGGVDFCFESAGQTSTIELGFSLIRKNGGQLLFASHPPEGEFITLSPHELISGKQIAGSWGGGVMPDKDIPILYKNLASSNVPLNTLLSNPYSLEEINQALDDLETGKALRPLIKMEH